MFHHAHPLAFSCIIFLATHLPEFAPAAPPTIKELVEGVDRRHVAYFDLRFDYDVRYRTMPQVSSAPPWLNTYGRFISTRDSFKLAGLYNAKTMRTWNGSWIQVSDNTLEKPVLTRFEATADEIEYSFIRWKPGMPGALEAHHRGTIGPRSYGRVHFENPFRDCLFLRFNAISVLDLGSQQPADILNRGMDSFVVQSERVSNGQTIYTLKGSIIPASQSNWIEVDVGGAPDFLVYRVEFFNENKSGAAYKIYEYSQFGQITYPARGYVQHEPFGNLFGFTYEFNVTSVRPLSDEDRQAWIPKWPVNTFVQNTTVQNPIEARQYLIKREIPLALLTHSARTAFFALFGCMAAIAVVVGLWFSLNSGSFQLRLAILVIGLAIPTVMLIRLSDQNLAIAIVILTLTTSILATFTRTVFGTSIQRITNDALPTNSPPDNCHRIGFREWSMLAVALLVTTSLAYNADATRIEKAAGIVYAVICVSILGILFTRLLSSRLVWASLILLASGAGLLLFLQVPLSALFELPYYGKDHDAWVISHIVGFTTLVTIAVILRLNHWHIGSDWKLSRTYRFSVREIGLWISTTAVLLAIFQWLTQSNI